MDRDACPPLKPTDHAEAVALFRAEVIGALSRQQLEHGELAQELRQLSQRRFRPPDSSRTRTFSVPTLERWLYAYRAGGLAALHPAPRSDRGHGRTLVPALRELLLDIRREHPCASVPLILRTLEADGRLDKGTVSPTCVRRLFRQAGLDRAAVRAQDGAHTRLRWQAERPGALWHADVCHGPALMIQGVRRPLRIHAILDDASRYIVAIQACHTEQEVDMLALFVQALRRFAAPDVLYLDNGSTYRGQVLRLACERLGTTLLHAAPYDPQARGKMERFWSTLRQGCLDYLGSLSSLHQVQVRLYAFVDQHYHGAPHAGLMGKSPGLVWAQALDQQPIEPDRVVTEAQLQQALTVHQRRRVSRDNVLSLDGQKWQTDRGFLAGRIVTVAHCLLGGVPWIEHNGVRLALQPVDPEANAHRKREPRPQVPTPPATPFDPPTAQLDQWLGRTHDDDIDDEEVF